MIHLRRPLASAVRSISSPDKVQEGLGSTFTLRLPRRTVTDTPRDPSPGLSPVPPSAEPSLMQGRAVTDVSANRHSRESEPSTKLPAPKENP